MNTLPIQTQKYDALKQLTQNGIEIYSVYDPEGSELDRVVRNLQSLFDESQHKPGRSTARIQVPSVGKNVASGDEPTQP